MAFPLLSFTAFVAVMPMTGAAHLGVRVIVKLIVVIAALPCGLAVDHQKTGRKYMVRWSFPNQLLREEPMIDHSHPPSPLSLSTRQQVDLPLESQRNPTAIFLPHRGEKH
ncbi:MAG: hypothetical protein KGQ89_05175 [Verrucomicrobia bacterium]|nr:hypothetical protein [Verrucomicrobiota bacterium]